MTHDELRESIAAYTLNALSPDDAREVQAYLATCDECQQDLKVLREVAADPQAA